MSNQGTSMTDEQVITVAEERYGSDDVDVLNIVEHVDGGAWVQALVWVPSED